jgi:hypothetical protein
VRLLAQTAEEISIIAAGSPHDASMTIQGEPSGVLAWALRDFVDVTFEPQGDPTVSTIMVVTPAAGEHPALGSAYVGQDFVLIRQWAPQRLSFEGFARWVMYRQADTPSAEQRVILWVREDVYRLVPAAGAE